MPAENGELFLRRGPLHVERGHQHALFLALLESLGELGGRRGLAGALQADHHDGHRRADFQIDRLGFVAQGFDEDVVDDLDDHLAGRNRLDDIGADRAGLHLVGEGTDHVERHVGVEQSPAHLAQRLGDVGLGKRAAPRELVENAGELVGKALEHGLFSFAFPLAERHGPKAKRARERDAPPDVSLPSLRANRFV